MGTGRIAWTTAAVAWALLALATIEMAEIPMTAAAPDTGYASFE
jgi:hypothetical protein